MVLYIVDFWNCERANIFSDCFVLNQFLVIIDSLWKMKQMYPKKN